MMESQILMDMASDDDDVDQLIMEVMVNFYGSSVKFAMPGGTNIVQRLRSHSAPKRWSGCSFGATNVSHKIKKLTMTTITTMMMFDENDEDGENDEDYGAVFFLPFELHTHYLFQWFNFVFALFLCIGVLLIII